MSNGSKKATPESKVRQSSEVSMLLSPPFLSLGNLLLRFENVAGDDDDDDADKATVRRVRVCDLRGRPIVNTVSDRLTFR